MARSQLTKFAVFFFFMCTLVHYCLDSNCTLIDYTHLDCHHLDCKRIKTIPIGLLDYLDIQNLDYHDVWTVTNNIPATGARCLV